MHGCSYQNLIQCWRRCSDGASHGGTSNLLKLLGGFLVGLLRSRAAREADIVFLLQQLLLAMRFAPTRLRLCTADRLVFVWLYQLFPALLRAAIIFKPETLLRWHRSGFRLYWRRKSRRRVGRPTPVSSCPGCGWLGPFYRNQARRNHAAEQLAGLDSRRQRHAQRRRRRGHPRPAHHATFAMAERSC